LDVDLLESSLTDWQLQEWAAFYDVEPWGNDVDWHRAGTIASAVVNSSPMRKKSGKPILARDFIPDYEAVTKSVKINTKPLRAEFRGMFAGRIKTAEKVKP